MLVLLLSLIVLQSCDLSSGQAGPTPTLGPDDFSLCQYLGLAEPVSEAGPIQTVPGTPPVQSTALTGKYPDIESSFLYIQEPRYTDLALTGRSDLITTWA